jgi:DNA-binding YbaB/EbfC family protein
MGMNLANIMKQVSNIQKKAGVMQQELANMELVGESAGGAVTVTCDGQGKFKSIKIAPQAINPDNPDSVDTEMLEMLEDLISGAMKEAAEKASAEMEQRMKQVTGGINIPGLNFGR